MQNDVSALDALYGLQLLLLTEPGNVVPSSIHAPIRWGDPAVAGFLLAPTF